MQAHEAYSGCKNRHPEKKCSNKFKNYNTCLDKEKHHIKEDYDEKPYPLILDSHRWLNRDHTHHYGDAISERIGFK